MSSTSTGEGPVRILIKRLRYDFKRSLPCTKYSDKTQFKRFKHILLTNEPSWPLIHSRNPLICNDEVIKCRINAFLFMQEVLQWKTDPESLVEDVRYCI